MYVFHSVYFLHASPLFFSVRGKLLINVLSDEIPFSLSKSQNKTTGLEFIILLTSDKKV